ncbi:DNA-binding transcriptional MerR regulator [Saccharothrix carnea]|uniref:DNA-binding transcriptional MerR regulator n=1 Tax=Saccharothrix carnea TaxID=1280637 RepID=A0A2P8IJ84_SACCR|nr:MerR family transcriptional regulator [Saccharothrix carnea]PSL58550.1 DNA-binding transcriptional MerR regulator [Saccharothrix carnea]
MTRLLGIGEFARRSRLSVKALRLYERQGLLRPAVVDTGNGYRRYREDQLGPARLVALLRRLDMPLAVVARIVAAPEDDRAGLVAEYWAEVEHRMAVQRGLAAHLRVVLSGGKGLLEMYEVKQREVPEQVVLTEQRHLKQPALSAWIEDSTDRLLKIAEDYGGISGAPFVIFHGELNEDSDGPVESCVPIGVAEPPSGVAARVEPAHREAYVRLAKAQVVFPQILSAYDAVAEWIKENGSTIADSPREVYFADWDGAGPEDEVCDIAFPMR